MKKLFPLFLSSLLLLGGCARNYVVTLNNGTQIGSKGKPKREGASYVYTDASGAKRRISAGSVAEISPTSMMGGSSDKFRYTPSK
jgi:hypothetical protein